MHIINCFCRQIDLLSAIKTFPNGTLETKRRYVLPENYVGWSLN